MSAYPNPMTGGSSSGSSGMGWGAYGGNAQNMFDNNSPIQPQSQSSNQYFASMPQFANPGQAQSPSSSNGVQYGNNGSPYQAPQQGTPGAYAGATQGPGGPNAPAYSENLGHGIIATGLQYPGLSQNFANYIQSQIGMGISPFDLSTNLPTGGSTAPGQLTAGLNPLLAQLMQFYQGGSSSSPGANTLSTIANQGVSALPEWQAMIGAQQQNIQQNQANLAEQFGSMGDLAGSPFGTAMSNYMQGTTASQNALLGQLQQSNIQNIQLPAAEGLMQGSNQMASGLQNLDQQAIQNMYQQFQTDTPQNNPLLQYMGGLSTLYPPTTKTPTGFDQFTSLLGSLQGAGFSTGGSGGTSIGF